MKPFCIFLIITVLFLNVNKVIAQIEWTGSTTTFAKLDYADWTLEINQDRITSNVRITRADNKGIFNIVTETEAEGNNGFGISPADTEWAFGTINDGVKSLTFITWGWAHAGDPSSLINQEMVLHLINDNIYIDIKFLSWSSGPNGGGGGGGGGFSYQRSTDQGLSSNELESSLDVKLFPNPSNDFIQFSGLIKTENYKIFNVLGVEICNGEISNKESINIQHLSNGLCFFKIENRIVIKFIKK